MREERIFNNTKTCCMRSKLSRSITVLILSGAWTRVEGKCSRLPSGNCWVNCMQKIFDIICNHVTEDMVRTDIQVFAGTAQQLRLYIWASPDIVRLSADTFGSVAKQILVLDLQDVTSLDAFPEIYGLVNLYRLSVWNSPALCSLSLELLPQSIYRLALSKVCITHFSNDFLEVPALPNMGQFVLRNVTIRHWQRNLLKVFPNITLLEITNSTIDISDLIEGSMAEIKTVTSLKLSDNRFEQATLQSSMEFLSALLKSIKVLPGADIDLSLNNLVISDVTVGRIQNLMLASRLNLRGNRIVAKSKTLAGMFQDFVNLEELDLGQTGLTAVQGMFGDLPKLTSLKLDNNNLRDMITVNIFEGSLTTNLSHLDLSFNDLDYIAFSEALIKLAPQVTYLNLQGNHLKVFLSNTSDFKMDAYSNLQTLILSNNGFTAFYGHHLSSLPKLEILDLSCNPLVTINKDVFNGLPDSLMDIDLSMCIREPQQPPWIDFDAFTTLPPVRVLRLNSGAYKKWIFTTLNLSANARNSLCELYLDDNVISYIRNDTMWGMPNLRLLSLNRNPLQSISAGSFATLPELRTLRLRQNRIGTISADTFPAINGQLQKLEKLDLTENGIYDIQVGAFDRLPRLKVLLIGGNSAEVQDVFLQGNQDLTHLGIQGYNRSCLKPEFFEHLPSLRWVLPDTYNLILANPDKRLEERDEFLLPLLEICKTGLDASDHEPYPGLRDYVGVTIHDTDEGDGVQYPILSAFLPLNYCPADDYVKKLNSIICTIPSSMSRSVST